MPIEIRELVIRATVDPQAGGGCGAVSAEAPGSTGTRGGGAGDGDLVQACVREVLRILEERQER